MVENWLDLDEEHPKSKACSESAVAAVRTWQLHVYRRVDREMGLATAEFDDEMRLLRTLVDALRTFRKHLSKVRFD